MNRTPDLNPVAAGAIMIAALFGLAVSSAATRFGVSFMSMVGLIQFVGPALLASLVVASFTKSFNLWLTLALLTWVVTGFVRMYRADISASGCGEFLACEYPVFLSSGTITALYVGSIILTVVGLWRLWTW